MSESATRACVRDSDSEIISAIIHIFFSGEAVCLGSPKVIHDLSTINHLKATTTLFFRKYWK